MNILIGSYSYLLANGIKCLISEIDKLQSIKIVTSGQQFAALLRDFEAHKIILTDTFYNDMKNILTDTDKILIIKLSSKNNNDLALKSIDFNAKPDALTDFFSNNIQLPNNEKDNRLSNREKEIVKLIALGFTTKEIAEKLYISPHTVITHRKNISNKLGIKTISGLTIYAILNGLIEVET